MDPENCKVVERAQPRRGRRAPADDDDDIDFASALRPSCPSRPSSDRPAPMPRPRGRYGTEFDAGSSLPQGDDDAAAVAIQDGDRFDENDEGDLFDEGGLDDDGVPRDLKDALEHASPDVVAELLQALRDSTAVQMLEEAQRTEEDERAKVSEIEEQRAEKERKEEEAEGICKLRQEAKEEVAAWRALRLPDWTTVDEQGTLYDMGGSVPHRLGRTWELGTSSYKVRCDMHDKCSLYVTLKCGRLPTDDTVVHAWLWRSRQARSSREDHVREGLHVQHIFGFR